MGFLAPDIPAPPPAPPLPPIPPPVTPPARSREEGQQRQQRIRFGRGRAATILGGATGGPEAIGTRTLLGA